MSQMGNDAVIAVFGGGCFWCTEAVFGELKGVEAVVPGYAGGHTDNPTYYQVCNESTGHAEVVKIEFDPTVISYRQLLEVFFKTHDPTTLNRQGADQGTRYRSIILYVSDEQRDQGANFIRELDTPGNRIVTEVVELNQFYEAEEGHKQFYKANSDSMYCQVIIRPKLKKMREEFSEHISLL